MPENSLLFDDDFWNFLDRVESLEQLCELNVFKSELGLDDEKLNHILSFLLYLDYEIFIHKKDEVEYIAPPAKRHKLNFDLNMIEWLTIHGVEKISKVSNEKSDNGRKIEIAIPNKEESFSIENAINEFNSKNRIIESQFGEKKGMILALEKTIPRLEVVKLSLKYGQVKELFTHKILYLKETLSLIAEDCIEGSLISVDLIEIEDFSIIPNALYQKSFRKEDVETFIKKEREDYGKISRVVLKLKEGECVDLEPRYIHFGRPFLSKTPEGSCIWAANLEKTDEVMEWLYEIRSKVEILNPTTFKIEFEQYCEKTKKLA